MLKKKLLALSCAGFVGALFAASFPAKAARIITKIDSLNDYRCDVRVKAESGTFELQNIAPEFSTSFDTHGVSRFDFTTEGTTKRIRLKDPLWNKTIGYTAGCASLYGSWGLASVDNGEKYLIELTTRKFLTALTGRKFLDVCWVIGTGVNEAGGEHRPGDIRILLAERRVQDDHLSLSWGDQLPEELRLEGAESKQAKIGPYEVEATCRSTEMPDATGEDVRKALGLKSQE